MNFLFDYTIILALAIGLFSGWFGKYLYESKNLLQSFLLGFVISVVFSAVVGVFVVIKFGVSLISLLGVPLAHIIGGLASADFYANIVQSRQEQRRIEAEIKASQGSKRASADLEGQIDTEVPTLLVSKLQDKRRLLIVRLVQIPFVLSVLFFYWVFQHSPNYLK